jgi:hypothetical protein
MAVTARPGRSRMIAIGWRERQAAEALFAPKPPVTEKPSVDDTARQPRAFETEPQRRRAAIETPGEPELQPPREIPRSQFARIRALVKYGMTVSQVAELYKVAAGDIKHVLREA